MFIDLFDEYAWAHRGYEKYLSTLPDDVRQHMLRPKNKRSAFVVVYGPSQVGKTTLILKMMRLSSEGMKAVSRVLRGKQQIGQSSTALATMYRRSQNNQWGLEWIDKQAFSSDSDMEKAVCDLRRNMESGQISVSSNVCVIYIPGKYFNFSSDNVSNCFSPEYGKKKNSSSKDDNVEIRILDLPGTEASNPREREYAKKVAQEFSSFATLTLLVSKADRLNVFFNGLEDFPSIKNWMNTPGRFRIVTTYSFTPESIRKSINEYGDDISRYKKDLIEQMETFRTLPEEAKVDQMYYPLEFGSSWEASRLKEDYPFLDQMMANQFENLLSDVVEANSSFSYLTGVLESKSYAHILNKERIQKVRREKNKFLKKIKDNNIFINNMEYRRITIIKSLKELDEYMYHLDVLEKEMVHTFASDLYNSFRSGFENFKGILEEKKRDVSFLEKIIYNNTISSQSHSLKNIIFGRYNDILGALSCKNNASFVSEDLSSFCLSAEKININLSELKNKNFQKVLSKLGSYWVKKYWSDDRYNQDKNLILKAYEGLGEDIISEINRYIEKFYHDFKMKKVKQKKQNERELYILDNHIHLLTKEEDNLENNLEWCENEEKIAKSDYERTCAIMEGIEDFFMEEYFCEINNIFNSVIDGDEVGVSLLNLCCANKIIESRGVVFDKLK